MVGNTTGESLADGKLRQPVLRFHRQLLRMLRVDTGVESLRFTLGFGAEPNVKFLESKVSESRAAMARNGGLPDPQKGQSALQLPVEVLDDAPGVGELAGADGDPALGARLPPLQAGGAADVLAARPGPTCGVARTGPAHWPGIGGRHGPRRGGHGAISGVLGTPLQRQHRRSSSTARKRLRGYVSTVMLGAGWGKGGGAGKKEAGPGGRLASWVAYDKETGSQPSA